MFARTDTGISASDHISVDMCRAFCFTPFVLSAITNVLDFFQLFFLPLLSPLAIAFDSGAKHTKDSKERLSIMT